MITRIKPLNKDAQLNENVATVTASSHYDA